MIAEFTQAEAFGDRSIAVWARERGEEERVRIDVPDYKPYFYVREEHAEEAEEMTEVDQVLDSGFEAIEGHKVVRVYLEKPGQTPSVRSRFDKHWESDVVYTMRFRIDVDLKATFEIDDRMLKQVDTNHYVTSWTAIEPRPEDEPRIPKRNCYFDIEVGGERQVQPDADVLEPVTCLTAFDSYEERMVTWVWRDDFDSEFQTRAFYDEVNDENVPWEVRRFDDELDMLGNFVKWFKSTGFDVISGWYSDGYDIPYIIRRIADLGVNPKAWSPMGQVEDGTSDYKQPKIHGIWMNDLMRRYDRIESPQRKSLEYVAKEEIGMEWEQHGGQIEKLWREDPETMIEYNAIDVLATWLIDEETDITSFFMDKMYSTGSQVEDIEKATRVIDYVHLYLANKHQKLPARGQHVSREIGGGRVFTPDNPGIQSTVVVVDLSKIYPNIMISGNLGYETYEGRHEIVVQEEVTFIDELKERMPGSGEDGEFNRISQRTSNGKTYNIIERTYHEGDHINPNHLGKKGRKNLWNEMYQMKADGKPERQFDWAFDDADIAGKLMPNGVRIDQDETALTVEVLEEMFDLREKYQRRAEKYDPTSDEYERLMNMRQVEKENINAVYGAMLYTNFRLFRPEIGETVTFIGRNLLEMIRQVVQEHFEGHRVVYGDTDSVMLELGSGTYETKEDIKRIGFEIEKRINEAMDDFAENFLGLDPEGHQFAVEFEKVYQPMFIGDERKKYAGRKTGDEDAGEDGGWGWLPEPELDITGFEYVRGDAASITGEVQWDIFESVLLEDGDKEDVREIVERHYNRMVNGEVEIWDAVKSPTLKSFDKRGAHVSSAKFTNRFFDDVEILEGNRVYWIYVDETGYNHDHQKLPENGKIAIVDGMEPPAAKCRCDECGNTWWQNEFVQKIYNNHECPECGASGSDSITADGCRIDWETLADKEVKKKARRLLEYLGWEDIADDLGKQQGMEGAFV